MARDDYESYRIRKIRVSVNDEEMDVVYLEDLQPPVGIQVEPDHDFSEGEEVLFNEKRQDIKKKR